MSKHVAKLGDVLEVQNGFAFKTEFFSDSEGLPLIRIRDLGSNETEARYTGPFRDEFIVEPGDYLIGMDGNFRCRRWSGPEALLNQRVCRLRNFSSRVLPEYVFYAIQPSLDAIEASTAFATVKHIAARQILDIDLALPSLDEQRRIVDLLSRAEGIVRLRREAQTKAQAIIPALFLEMFGDPATNPKGWRDHQLDELLTGTKLGLVRGAKEMGQDRTYAYLRMDAVGDGVVRLHDLRRVDASPKEVEAYVLKAGDFLFNTRNSRELVGKTGLVTKATDAPVLFNNNLMRMRFDARVLLPAFVNWQFQTSHIRQQLEAIKRGTTTVFAIYYKDLKNIRLRVPPLELQVRFVTLAASTESIASQQTEALKKAEAIFQSLLARTFAREFAASVAAPEEEGAAA